MSSEILKQHIERMNEISQDAIAKTREYSAAQGKVIQRLLHPLAKLIMKPAEPPEPTNDPKMIS